MLRKDKETMADTMNGLKRTHMNGTIESSLLGQEVVLAGWCAKARNLGSLIFVDLRDRTGMVQLVFDGESDKDIFEKAVRLSF